MAFQLRVNCTCGKILKIPEKYAGKKGKCPNCGKKLAIPSKEGIKEKIKQQKEVEQQEKHCPTCGAYIKPGDKVCVSCNMNLKTGEWEIGNIPKEKPIYKTTPFLVSFCVLLFLIIANGFILIDYFFSENTGNGTTLSPLPATHVNIESQDNTNTKEVKEKLGALLAMPHKDMKTLLKKMGLVDQFVNKKLGVSDFTSKYNQLLIEKRELEAQNSYKKWESKKQKDVVSNWYALTSKIKQYSKTKCAAAMKTKQKVLEKEMKLLAQKNAEQMHEMLTGKNYEKVINDSFNWLTEIIKSTCPVKPFINEVENLQDICMQASMNQAQNRAKMVVETAEEKDENNLEKLKQKINIFVAKYRKYQEDWAFHTAFNQVKSLVEKAEKLKKTHPDDLDIKNILNIYEEAKLLDQSWQYAVEGVKDLKGTSKVFFLKNKSSVAGKIEKYENNKIYLVQNKKVTAVDLASLATHSFAKLIEFNKDKNVQVQLALACFYYINKESTLCKNACEQAVKLGMSSAKLEKYQNWATAILEEVKTKLASEQNKQEEAKKKLEEIRETHRLERLRKKARSLIDKIIKEYKRHNDKVVMEYLYTLKTDVGDQPGGRDELIKLNYIIEKEEGHSLEEIAEKSFKYCPFCRNEGEIKCPDCSGKGYIPGKERWLGGKNGNYSKYTEEDKYCKRCKGSGEIDCPHCYAKRHNRRYILTEAYYDNF